jgi:AcrR family transcriptional regulator
MQYGVNDSIDQIIRKTDVTKGAFYHYFSSKSELGYAKIAVFIVMLEEGSFGLVKSMADRIIFDSLYVTLRDYLHSKSDVKG